MNLSINDSNDPSYTRLELPYRVICRQRYRQAGVLQRKQFVKEIKDHELLQTKALDGVRIHREFCNSNLCPPRIFDKVVLSDSQKSKIEKILANEIA
ncbi:hypothetical protein NQ315_015744 [Exocentrus adspersus]|uniref:Uncharacterized protein n=1 Tax=Exocentrus adspersus TaxID=1586481 RepID=A0AAV8W4R8_9CUCU|nr:hypothetical protein NQ315_015744 [Exocentrus adspersus]